MDCTFSLVEMPNITNELQNRTVDQYKPHCGTSRKKASWPSNLDSESWNSNCPLRRKCDDVVNFRNLYYFAFDYPKMTCDIRGRPRSTPKVDPWPARPLASFLLALFSSTEYRETSSRTQKKKQKKNPPTKLVWLCGIKCLWISPEFYNWTGTRQRDNVVSGGSCGVQLHEKDRVLYCIHDDNSASCPGVI